jgi:hypothetical protein
MFVISFMVSRANLQLPLLFLCYSSDPTSVDLIRTRPDICDEVLDHLGVHISRGNRDKLTAELVSLLESWAGLCQEVFPA